MFPVPSELTARPHPERSNRMLAVTLLALLALIAPLSVLAAASDALDRDTISRWISATEALQSHSDAMENEALEADETFVPGDARDLTRFADIGRAYGAMYDGDAGMRDAIRAHGFSSAEEWSDISARIVGGLIAIETEDTRPQLDAELAAAMRELENTPELPPDVRAIFLEQMQELSGAMNAMMEGVREDDLPALRALRGDLGAVIELGEDADAEDADR